MAESRYLRAPAQLVMTRIGWTAASRASTSIRNRCPSGETTHSCLLERSAALFQIPDRNNARGGAASNFSPGDTGVIATAIAGGPGPCRTILDRRGACAPARRHWSRSAISPQVQERASYRYRPGPTVRLVRDPSPIRRELRVALVKQRDQDRKRFPLPEQ